MTLTGEQTAMLEVFERHVQAEIDGDLETTMATMTADPHNILIANRMGGAGYEGVRAFYRDHLVGKFFPPDTEVTDISRTIGTDQLVIEQVLRFTHSQSVEWMLPGVPPTGRKVEIALVVVAKIEGGRIAHEHVYWDQAAVLVQVGLLEPRDLPVCGTEPVQLLMEPTLPLYRTGPATETQASS
ncbi:MAG: ester cyclase [Candidatus Limnocylindrales bacterium]